MEVHMCLAITENRKRFVFVSIVFYYKKVPPFPFLSSFRSLSVSSPPSPLRVVILFINNYRLLLVHYPIDWFLIEILKCFYLFIFLLFCCCRSINKSFLFFIKLGEFFLGGKGSGRVGEETCSKTKGLLFIFIVSLDAGNDVRINRNFFIFAYILPSSGFAQKW